MKYLQLIPDINRQQFYSSAAFAGFTPYPLRHSVTTHLLDQGIRLRHIQVLLGHSSSKTTELYKQVSVQEIGKIKNPLDGFYKTAPFPNKKYKDGAKAFPLLIPSKPNHQGVERIKKVKRILSEWNKPALVLFSDKDKIMSGLEKFFHKLIPTIKEQEKIIIKNAGHFLQEEKGKEIAVYIDRFIKEELITGANKV